VSRVPVSRVLILATIIVTSALGIVLLGRAAPPVPDGCRTTVVGNVPIVICPDAP
jgi:hypothetical protein